MEGDLLWFPLTRKFFEIKFVEHENPFYQLGKNYVYSLNVELFQYSEETIDTQLELQQEQEHFQTEILFTRSRMELHLVL